MGTGLLRLPGLPKNPPTKSGESQHVPVAPSLIRTAMKRTTVGQFLAPQHLLRDGENMPGRAAHDSHPPGVFFLGMERGTGGLPQAGIQPQRDGVAFFHFFRLMSWHPLPARHLQVTPTQDSPFPPFCTHYFSGTTQCPDCPYKTPRMPRGLSPRQRQARRIQSSQKRARPYDRAGSNR